MIIIISHLRDLKKRASVGACPPHFSPVLGVFSCPEGHKVKKIRGFTSGSVSYVTDEKWLQVIVMIRPQITHTHTLIHVSFSLQQTGLVHATLRLWTSEFMTSWPLDKLCHKLPQYFSYLVSAPWVSPVSRCRSSHWLSSPVSRRSPDWLSSPVSRCRSSYWLSSPVLSSSKNSPCLSRSAQ